LLTSVFSNETHQLPTFAVTVANRGTEPVILTRGNLRVFSGDQRVRIYTADQLTTRIDSEAKEKADAYTGRQAEVFLQSDATRVDPSAALANLEAAKRANLAGKNRTGREEQLRALANLLDHVKIAPNASGGGVARLHEPDIQSGKPLKFMVAIDNEIYAFTFDVKGG
jgi:hypothetical protein